LNKNDNHHHEERIESFLKENSWDNLADKISKLL